MNDHDGEWQRSHSQHPRRSLRGDPLEQEEEALLEAEQDDVRHTQASIGLTTATAVSAGSTNGGATAVSALAT